MTGAPRFETHRASPRGFAQAYLREGHGGAPLLLVHGWPETRRIWWRNVAPLAASGFDVIAPDLRGFGDSAVAPDGFGDVPSHSRDLYALVRGELGLPRVTVVAGDLGGAVAQDLALRFPGFVERLVIFNCPLPYLKGEMDGLATRAPVEAADYFVRQGSDADALAAELDTPEKRRRYIAAFYGSRFWAHPGAFTPADVDFMTEPYADGAKLRAGFAAYESVLQAEARSERPLIAKNPTPAVILFGSADHVIYPDFDAMAEMVFPDHVGPFRLPRAGHFLQWEAASELDSAIVHLCRPGPPAPAQAQTVYLSLGSNLGAREAHLVAAFAALRATRGVHDVVASPVFETAPVGPGDQGPYLNASARAQTTLEPRALLARLLEIEASRGRERGERNAARTLDLDLLFYGERTLSEPGLTVPHPRLAERPFVLEPLRTLAPDLVHPGLGESIEALAARVDDPATVRRRD